MRRCAITAAEAQHKVFKNIAARGKTSVDWFFGNKAASGCQRQRRVARASSWLLATTFDRTPAVKLLQQLFGRRVCRQRLRLSEVSEAVVQERWRATDSQIQTQHEKSLAPVSRPTFVAEARHHRKHHWSVEKHFFANRIRAQLVGAQRAIHKYLVDESL